MWPRVNKDVMRESVAAVRGQSRSQQPIPFLDPLWNVGHREVSLYWCPFWTLEVGYVAARSWTALIIIGIVDLLSSLLFSSYSFFFVLIVLLPTNGLLVSDFSGQISLSLHTHGRRLRNSFPALLMTYHLRPLFQLSDPPLF